MSRATRIERDSMGDVAVPVDALYGAQTQRAVENFAISRQPMPERFVRALVLQKAAAARANKASTCALAWTRTSSPNSTGSIPHPSSG